MARNLISIRTFLISVMVAMLCAVTFTTANAQDRGRDYRDHQRYDQRYGGGELVRIQNRSKSDRYLNIEHGRLVSTHIKWKWDSARWYIEDGRRNSVRLRNFWKSDRFIQSRDGYAEAAPIERRRRSALWVIEPVRGTGYVRLRSRQNRDEYLHTEHGDVEVGPIRQGWWSAMWKLAPVN